jgi:hypothetical protein
MIDSVQLKTVNDLDLEVPKASLRPTRPGLRLFIDARKLLDGGIGRYISNLLIGFVRGGFLDSGDIAKIGVLLSPKAAAVITGSQGAGAEHFQSWASRVEIYCDAAVPYSFDEYFGLAKRLPISEYDLFHSPHYTLPFGLKVPSVVTVHDVLHITHGERWYYPFIAKKLLASALSRAKQVVTVSSASAMELYRLNLSESIHARGAIHVIPNAVDMVGDTMAADAVQGWNRTSDSYLLSVISTDKPHKGLTTLLDAYERYRLRVKCPLDLVLVGAGSAKYILRDRVSPQGVTALGEVDELRYQQLMRGASALLVASSSEGFCVPFIEAHSRGVPVVHRPISALRELHIVGFDVAAADMSVAAFGEAIIEKLSRLGSPDAVAQHDVIERTVQVHSPELVAERTLGVYWKALERAPQNQSSILSGRGHRRGAMVRAVAKKFADARQRRIRSRFARPEQGVPR